MPRDGAASAAASLRERITRAGRGRRTRRSRAATMPSPRPRRHADAAASMCRQIQRDARPADGGRYKPRRCRRSARLTPLAHDRTRTDPVRARRRTSPAPRPLSITTPDHRYMLPSPAWWPGALMTVRTSRARPRAVATPTSSTSRRGRGCVARRACRRTSHLFVPGSTSRIRDEPGVVHDPASARRNRAEGLRLPRARLHDGNALPRAAARSALAGVPSAAPRRLGTATDSLVDFAQARRRTGRHRNGR